MTRITRTSLAIAALAVVAMGASACSAGAGDAAQAADAGGAQKVLVATGASPKPYTFLDENDELTGYDIEILKEIDARNDELELEFQVAEFPALFAGLDSGRFDVVANNLSATDERREKYDFSDPYIEAQFGIIQKEGAKPVSTLDDLAGKKTYGEPGLNFTKVLEAYNEQHPDAKIEIEYTELDLQSQYNALAAGQVDFLFNELVVFNGYGGDAGLGLEFTELDGGYLADTFGTNLYSAYAISRQAPDAESIVEQLDAGLAELREDGTLVELSKEFFDGVDVTPKD
ncbi:transporter substrate-binding domain-containing protein [Leucobacter tenebrionis]|uniref:transporter substrate-binding domain-containing protein n=1 Tax=Leucobacter tenebrionis TaxID=2873270 RepID=UPI001CA737B0|nr:transporter substrate-binding domain-containing protein [Leucobacter tenebrionis]QZY50577.1 transporter substrate-binding domain-containing protein [Leucobacter tenebrionis]